MTFRLRTAAAAGLLLTGIAAPSQAAAPSSCFDSTRATTVEEQRLDRTTPASTEPVAAQILRRTGLDRNVTVLTRLLCQLPDEAAARAVVRAQGEELWYAATARTHSTP